MSLVQKSNFSNVGPGAGTCTFGGAVSAANRIVVKVWTLTGTAPSIPTDNGTANIYTLDFSFAGTAAGSTEKFWFYSCNTPAGAPTVVTITSANNHKSVAYEVSQTPSSSFLDITGGGAGGNAAATTTPSFAYTTNTGGSLSFGILSVSTGGSDVNFTPGASYTSDGVNPDTVYFEHSTAALGAAGSYNLDGSIPSLQDVWNFAVVAYKQAATDTLMGQACY